MPTHRQLSFLGTLWLGHNPVHTLATLEGQPVWVHKLGAPVPPGISLASTVRNDSARLGCHPGETSEALLLYFRYTPDGYRLFVREPGEHFGKGVFVDHIRYLSVRAIQRSEPSPFELCVAGSPVNLLDLAGDTHPITLASNGEVITRFIKRYHYLRAEQAPAQAWRLHILERGVPWLNNPDEA